MPDKPVSYFTCFNLQHYSITVLQFRFLKNHFQEERVMFNVIYILYNI